MKSDNNQRFVFQFWHAGVENAPPVVLSCIDSWRKGCERIGFKHVVISEVDLDYWEAQFPESIGKSLQDFRHHATCWEDAKWRRYSDMLRLALLKCFNGIWADATLLLMRPIEDWLPDPSHAGGLQLCKGASDRLIENWLICSLGESQLLNAWLDHYVEFNLSAQRDASQYLAKKYSVPGIMFRIQRFFPRAKTWWFGWTMRSFYNRHPYFANYYSFEYVLRKHPNSAQEFQIFLPYDLVGWSFFNSYQKPDWKLNHVNPALVNSLMLLPFIKLDWKRSPQKGLENLDEALLLRFLWDRSSTQLG
jgi:hypothetical protein